MQYGCRAVITLPEARKLLYLWSLFIATDRSPHRRFLSENQCPDYICFSFLTSANFIPQNKTPKYPSSWNVTVFVGDGAGLCCRLRRDSACICQHNSATFSFSSAAAPAELWHFKGPGRTKRRSSAGKTYDGCTGEVDNLVTSPRKSSNISALVAASAVSTRTRLAWHPFGPQPGAWQVQVGRWWKGRCGALIRCSSFQIQHDSHDWI